MIETEIKNKNLIYLAVIVVVILLGGLFFINRTDRMPAESDQGNIGRESSLVTLTDGDEVVDQLAAVGTIESVGQNYSGKLLAGSKTGTVVLEFNQADYKQAVADDKLIFIYFVSDWDTDSATEIVESFYPAFTQMNDPEVVGFVATFGDASTTLAEKEVARNFGVAISKTKIFVRDGERLLKSFKAWDKEDYLTQTAKLLK